MKLVFLETGDYIEFVPQKNKFIDLWFEYVFDYKLNEFNITSSATSRIENTISILNYSIEKALKYAHSRIENFEFDFIKLEELDQSLLNHNHKQWVFATEKYKNELYPQPNFWKAINEEVHNLEFFYSAYFGPKVKFNHLGEEYTKYLRPEDCIYDHKDLVIHYTNLGKHQYHQWCTGSTPDEETNNYRTVSTNFEYQFNVQTPPSTERAPAPPGYAEWCKSHNLEVLPPYVPIGKFQKYNRHEVRQIMHRNLKNNKTAKFEYE